jgi:hypothetical protein
MENFVMKTIIGQQARKRYFYNNYQSVLISLLILISCLVTQCRTIRVSQLGSGGDGNSWQTAYRNISDAISNASPGDEIWVRGGTYNDSIFVEINVRILGGFTGDEFDGEADQRNPIENPTIIDGGGSRKGLMGCISMSFIDGFTLRNAASAALLVYNGGTTVISRCRIENNYPTNGVTFGGGIVVNNATPSFIQCVVVGNSRGTSGGGVCIEEGATVTMNNCSIIANSSNGGSGGGISCSLSTLIMENCIVTNNHAYPPQSDDPWSIGGGIVIAGNGSMGILRNCLIANNWAKEWSQIAFGTTSIPSIDLDNCTIIGGQAADIHWRNVAPTMTNCVIWGADGMLSGEQGQADISYSCIQGGYPGLGNISDDPLFRNAATGDYRLLPDSPCIDTAGTSGPSDDLNGKPRPVDIAGIGREVTDTYDMGAYEFQVEDLPHPSAVSEWMLYGVGE